MSPSWAANSAWPCPVEEEATLLESVELLDQKMHEIREGGKVIGLEKIAIPGRAESGPRFLQARVGDFDIGTIQRRIKHMNATIDAALEGQADLF